MPPHPLIVSGIMTDGLPRGVRRRTRSRRPATRIPRAGLVLRRQREPRPDRPPGHAARAPVSWPWTTTRPTRSRRPADSRYLGSFALSATGKYHREGPAGVSARASPGSLDSARRWKNSRGIRSLALKSRKDKERRLTSPTAARGTASPQPAPAGTWATCPSCSMERKVIDGVMVPHRRWSDQEQKMQGCPGSVASMTITFSG